MLQIFWSSPDRTRTYSSTISSSRTSGAKAVLDPRKPGNFYRSVVGN